MSEQKGQHSIKKIEIDACLVDQFAAWLLHVKKAPPPPLTYLEAGFKLFDSLMRKPSLSETKTVSASSSKMTRVYPPVKQDNDVDYRIFFSSTKETKQNSHVIYIQWKYDRRVWTLQTKSNSSDQWQSVVPMKSFSRCIVDVLLQVCSFPDHDKDIVNINTEERDIVLPTKEELADLSPFPSSNNITNTILLPLTQSIDLPFCLNGDDERAIDCFLKAWSTLINMSNAQTNYPLWKDVWKGCKQQKQNMEWFLLHMLRCIIEQQPLGKKDDIDSILSINSEIMTTTYHEVKPESDKHHWDRLESVVTNMLNVEDWNHVTFPLSWTRADEFKSILDTMNAYTTNKSLKEVKEFHYFIIRDVNFGDTNDDEIHFDKTNTIATGWFIWPNNEKMKARLYRPKNNKVILPPLTSSIWIEWPSYSSSK